MPEPQRARRYVVFVDTEYTNLDTARADVVEVSLAVEDNPIISGIPPHTLAGAEPKALEVNRYYERGLDDKSRWDRDIIDMLARASAGETILGCNPRVDAHVLSRRLGYEPWHYRLGDLENIAWLLLDFDQIPGLRQISEKLRGLGFDIPQPDHTSGGDVAATRACFRALQRIARHLLHNGLPRAEELEPAEEKAAEGWQAGG